jgi:hypothetical protein
MEKAKETVQLYTTAQLCEIVGLTAPRIHQMRTGQTIKNRKTNKEYIYPPLLVEGVHWKWDYTEVMFFPNALELLVSTRKNKKSTIKTIDDANPSMPAKRGRKKKETTEPVSEVTEVSTEEAPKSNSFSFEEIQKIAAQVNINDLTIEDLKKLMELKQTNPNF